MFTVLTPKTGDPPDVERTLLGSQKQGALSVEQVITRLFPTPTLGQIFYQHFLERAAGEETILPDEPPDTVAICTQSIATLAKEISMGADTTQKYVVIYRALGLLKKRKLMGKLVFALRTGIYHPPDGLEANLLHVLQKSRRKLHEMATDVLARCKIYGLVDQDFQAAVTSLHDLLHSEPGETRRTLAQRLLHAQYAFGLVLSAVENLSTTHSQENSASRFDHHPPRSAIWVDSSASHALQAPPQSAVQREFEDEMSATNLSSRTRRVDSPQLYPAKESTTPLVQGRFGGETPGSHLPQQPCEVDSPDSEPGMSLSESTRVAQSRRFIDPSHVKNLPTPGRQVDSLSQVRPPESTNPCQMSRFDDPTETKNHPGQREQVDSSNGVYVNVITFIRTITLNVKPVAAFCCTALGESPSKQPIYLKLFRECDLDAEAIAGALLFTLAHQRDGTIRNPASVFVTRCRDYHAQGVSDEAAVLVQQYGSLTYTRLLETLRSPATPPPSARSAPFSAGGASSSATPSSLPSLPRWGTLPRLVGVDHDRSGMSREEALQVIRRVHGDRRTKLCRVDLEPLADGSYAVLLDNTITAIPRQTYFFSLQDWEARVAAIKDCFELFGVACTGRQRLADALKARRVQR